MKNYLLKLLLLALILALAAFVLTPVALRQLRLWGDARIAEAYLGAAQSMSLLDCGTLLSRARDYDQARGAVRWSDPFSPQAPADGDYAALLDPVGSGVMCVLEIPKLGKKLPVYHGGGTERARVEHLPDSSLPVGGEGGQCVLYALRDGRRYDPFSGLDRLLPGDCFYLHTLQDTLIYEVAQASRVPAEALAESPVEGVGDECVLAAATDGGDRLAVRGRRVSRRNVSPAEDTRLVSGRASGLVFAAPLAVAGWILLAVVERLRWGVRRRRRRHMKL